ncbi:MAG: YkgJ family cysteine cluster protein [Verrucomicrobia bacterium]|nr:YkgJ family cysteine cluster protein [Verrucomicrobiota bacterium]
MRKSIPLKTVVARLCPQCALCCNGVLFKDVELQPGDDATKLKPLGLPLSPIGNRQSAIHNFRFPQPCAALDGCRCRIHADRPARCRQFECALLKSVAAGKTEVDAALRAIRVARQRADQVHALLREVGDVDSKLALSLRFKRTKRRFEASPPDDARAEVFGRLTLAVHDLNLWLRGKFYP